ncbi:MAG: hypothetical protein RE469_07815 [Cuniculiplasma divulgatum]|nr:MAG: hypothetical protein RE469_07815 [Cuniculiplasma divulgatum]
MKLGTQDTIRVAYLVMAGLMLTGASTAWDTAGYLNIFAWILEWTEILLTFYFIIAATLDSTPLRVTRAYILMAVSAVILLISISFVGPKSMSIASPYIPNPIFYLIFGVPVIAGITVFVLSERRNDIRKTSTFFFICFAASIMLLTYIFYLAGPRLPTDETVLDLYAGHIFLKGLDPYNSSLTLAAFPFYHFPYYYDTPLTNGGYVSTYSYPALSFITMLPAVIFNLKPALVMLPFFIIPIFLVWYKAWSMKEWILSIFILMPFLSFVMYAPQVEFGDLNIVWASLLMISYFFISHTKISGAFYGASLSVKQFPALMLPFLLYYIFRTNGLRKTIIWLITATGVFLAINGYFMLTNFHFFMHNLLQDEFSPLLGVGFGISQISFLGFIDIPRIDFTIALIVTFLALLGTYVLFFDKMRYALFAFPILIFFFNYRLFIQYLAYWLLISILPAIDLIHYRHDHAKDQDNYKPPVPRNIGNHRNLRLLITFLVVLMAMAVAVGYHEGVSQNPGHFEINSVKFLNYNSTGFVEEAVVNITFYGTSISQTPVLFRFIIPGEIVNVNTCLWKPEYNTTLQRGHPADVVIVPLYSVYSFPHTSPYRLVAYYNTMQGAYSHNLSLA